MSATPPRPPECRFCLEPGASPSNPLIEPCPCKGSVRFVHWQCLKRWVKLDPATNGRACTICRLPFEVSVFPGMESTDGIPRWAHFAIYHSSVVNAIISYGILILIYSTSIFDRNGAVWRTSRDGALASQAIYALCVWLYWRVKDRPTYSQIVLRSRIPGMLAAHAYSLYGILAAPATSDYLGIAIMHLMLKMYWLEHCAAIGKMNERLLDG